jgi:hypothetical protein
MKKIFLILAICLVFTSCNNTVSNIESSDVSSDVFVQSSSEELVSSETIIAPKSPEDIVKSIATAFSLRDLIDIDSVVLESMSEIQSDEYVEFFGKVSCALDNFDLAMVFYTSSEEQAQSLISKLNKAKENYSNLYLDNLKNEIENSIVFTDNGYVFWVVAKEVSNAEEVIKGML